MTSFELFLLFWIVPIFANIPLLLICKNVLKNIPNSDAKDIWFMSFVPSLGLGILVILILALIIDLIIDIAKKLFD